MAEAILSSPLKMISVFDKALAKALMQTYEEEKPGNEELSLKLNVHIRLIGMFY